MFLLGVLFVGGSGRSRALLAVVLWLGGLFYGGMSLLCRCLRALCVVLLVSDVCVVFQRFLCVVSIFMSLFFALFGDICMFFLMFLFVVVFCFATIFLHDWCPFLYFFLLVNVVCCVLLVQHFCANRYFSCCFPTFVCFFNVSFCRWFVFFCANFSSFWWSFLYFFCCRLVVAGLFYGGMSLLCRCLRIFLFF